MSHSQLEHGSDHGETGGGHTWWIARPENTETVWRILLAVCGLLLAIDFAYHQFVSQKHGYFAFERMPFFHAGYGLIAFIFVVLSGKQMRKALMRPEGYYGGLDSEEANEDASAEHSGGDA